MKAFSVGDRVFSVKGAKHLWWRDMMGRKVREFEPHKRGPFEGRIVRLICSYDPKLCGVWMVPYTEMCNETWPECHICAVIRKPSGVKVRVLPCNLRHYDRAAFRKVRKGWEG